MIQNTIMEYDFAPHAVSAQIRYAMSNVVPSCVDNENNLYDNIQLLMDSRTMGENLAR
jgi:hypothetical protein